MNQTCLEPDPYAELDFRADAWELSEEFRKPIRIARRAVPGKPSTQTRLSAYSHRNRI